MLPATRGAEVLYINVVRPALGNVKARAQQQTGTTNPFQKDSGSSFNPAGTTATSSFERELATADVSRMSQS
jgi:receptor expression-enhancing protein 5/6